jgi:GNAT superfamily N-acetyltransferase
MPAVVPYLACPDRVGIEAAIEAIFFEASGRTFEPGPEREAFRERWLGRFLARWPELAFVLMTEPRDAAAPVVGGYLVGCLDDPAASPLFDDISYLRDFAEICADFPAHLHINMAPAARGRGLGGLLVGVFAAVARERGAPGMHVVTAAGARNVGFYGRLGFSEQGRTVWNGKPLVLLGCRLA